MRWSYWGKACSKGNKKTHAGKAEGPIEVHLLHEKDKCQLFFIGMLIEIQMPT
jgi:hypothetical protein